MRIAEMIMSLDDQLRDEWGIDCAPWGDDYIKFILELARKIMDKCPTETLVEEFETIYSILEDYNFHMANHAIELIVKLDRYSGRR